MANRQQRRAAMRAQKKARTLDEKARFAYEVRTQWSDQKIWDMYHKPVTQELIDTCAQNMLEDILAVLRPHFRKPTNDKLANILHSWYDSQDTPNTRTGTLCQHGVYDKDGENQQ